MSSINSSMTTKLTKTESGLAVSGMLVFSSVTGLLKQGSQTISSHSKNKSSNIEINCEEMHRIDSAGIALLLEWQRQCGDAKLTSHFVGLSKQAESLIQAYRLESIIAA